MILAPFTKIKSVHDVYPFDWDVKPDDKTLEEVQELFNSGDKKVDAKGRRIE